MTKDEFFDVYRMFRPQTTREEFEIEWKKFQDAKAIHEARMKVN